MELANYKVNNQFISLLIRWSVTVQVIVHLRQMELAWSVSDLGINNPLTSYQWFQRKLIYLGSWTIYYCIGNTTWRYCEPLMSPQFTCSLNIIVPSTRIIFAISHAWMKRGREREREREVCKPNYRRGIFNYYFTSLLTPNSITLFNDYHYRHWSHHEKPAFPFNWIQKGQLINVPVCV